jgi:hypothetical protein
MKVIDHLERYAHWVKVQDSAWAPPPSLNNRFLRTIERLPVISLNQAVDMMAFGDECIPQDPEEQAARRCQASRALCDAARLNLVRALGNPNRRGDASDPIPRAYFDTPRQLGHADNSLETALDKLSDDDFVPATNGNHQKWFNVRIECPSLLLWLRVELEKASISKNVNAADGATWYSPRDILIDRVQRGEITPDEAEANAREAGVGPLATTPEPVDFDPEKSVWWTLPMALAWIAWRDIRHVREHCSEYRVECNFWAPVSRKIPAEEGRTFKQISGHELKRVQAASVARLKLVGYYMSSHGELPDSTQMTVAEAQKNLIDALSAGQLIAIAKDAASKIVEIPQREWPFLNLSEDWGQDILQYQDFGLAFSDVRLKQEDLKRVWPEFIVQPYIIEPMTRAETAGYVPLSSALYWVMTEGGNIKIDMQDKLSWNRSVDRLLPLISTGQIEILGKPANGGGAEPIDGRIFSMIFVSHPMHDEISSLGNEDPWVSCTPYVNPQYWGRGHNDKLYLHRAGAASWTQLQVKKSDVLRHFVIPEVEKDTGLAPIVKKSTEKLKPGRKRGDGSYERHDRELFPKMEALIATKKVASPEAAARELAEEIFGAGNVESRIERLAKRFRASKRAV